MMKWMLAFCLCAGLGCQTPKESDIIYKPPIQWQYKLVSLPNPQNAIYSQADAEERLNKAGWDGWEAVAVGMDGTVVILRRRKRGPERPMGHRFGELPSDIFFK